MSDDELLTPVETASLLRLPHRTLAQWRYLGRGPRYAVAGCHVRYRRADVLAWLDEHSVSPGAPDGA